MLVGVVSDTHGHVPFSREAARVLEALEVERILHCGDIGSGDVIEVLRGWPVDYVLGNVDSHEAELAHAARALGHTMHGAIARLEILGRRVAVLHGDDTRLLRESIASGKYDLVCHGHTHQKRLESVGPTTVLNPGAIYRANPRSCAVVRFPELEVTHVDL